MNRIYSRLFDHMKVLRKPFVYFYSAVFIFSLLWINGCSSQVSKDFFRQIPPHAEGRQFLEMVDKTIDQHHVRNFRFAPVEGFPYLRTDRFLEEAKKYLRSESETQKWVQNLQQMDLDARYLEVQNLPQQSVINILEQAGTSDDASREKLMELIKTVSDGLLKVEQGITGYYQTVKESVQFPDDYSTTLRVFGLYPVVALPVIYFSNGFFDQIRQWYQTPLEDLPVVGKLTAYIPDSENRFSQADIQNLFSAVPQDKLNRQIFTPDDLQNLARFFCTCL